MMNMMQSWSVTSVTPQALLNACAQRGLPTRRILRGAQIAPATLLDPAARIPAAQMAALWQQARHAAGEDLIAVEAAMQLPIGRYRVFDYLLLSSATGGEGLRHVIESYPLLNEAFQFSMTRGPRLSSFALSRMDGGADLPHLYVLYIFATMLVRLQHMLGFRPVMREFRIAAPAEAPSAAVRAWFGAPLRFGQPRNEIVFDSDLLAQPSVHSDPALCAVLEQHARGLLRHHSPGVEFLAAVHSAVASRAGQGAPSLAGVAADLALSSRTLQRRLAEHGLTFQQLAGDARRERCTALLADSAAPLAEVAYELGFSEPSAFHRAFKRWTGMTPRAFRP